MPKRKADPNPNQGHYCPGCLKRIDHISLHRFESYSDMPATFYRCDDCLNELRVENGFTPLGAYDHSALIPQEAVPHDLLLARVKKYRISIAQYEAMLAAQRNRCAICGHRPIKLGDLVVDHNHETGKVRGLLCGNCNTALGFFQDSPDVLDAAMQYLEERGCYGADALAEDAG